MGKAILIVDMPEKCDDCKFHRVGNCGYEDCFLTRKAVFSGNENKNEAFCPLKEAPKKIVEENRRFSKDYSEGFNACIDEVLKERDEN